MAAKRLSSRSTRSPAMISPLVDTLCCGGISLIVAAGISLHHYFIDAVIWRIRNPEVRASLFGHLSQGKEKR